MLAIMWSAILALYYFVRIWFNFLVLESFKFQSFAEIYT